MAERSGRGWPHSAVRDRQAHALVDVPEGAEELGADSPARLRAGSSIASAGGAGGETDGTPRDDTELQMLEALHRASDKSLLSAKDKRKSNKNAPAL